MEREIIVSSIKEISRQLIKNWPLYSFVTSNPLAGLEQLPFNDAIKEIRKYVRIDGYPSATLFSQALKEHQIDKKLIEKQLQESGIVLSVQESLGQMYTLEQRIESKRRLDEVDRNVIKWLAAFLDQGMAEWAMPYREKGFYNAWRTSVRFDNRLPKKEEIATLPDNALDTLEHYLQGFKPDDIYNLFKYHLLALPGWTGYIRFLNENPNDWQKSYPITLADYLAVRLTLCRQFDKALLPENNTQQQERDKEDRIKSAWLKAMELSYQERIIKQVQSKAQSERTNGNNAMDAQFVFCIDTRSERIRRTVEQAGNYETFGYAGFFGIAMDYRSTEKNISNKSCPPIVDSVFEAVEDIIPERINDADKYSFYNNLRKALRQFIFTLKNNIPASFGYVESTGFYYGAGLLAKTINPTFLYRIKDKITGYTGHPEWFSKVRLSPKGDEKGAKSSLSTKDKALIAKTAFDLMGWDHFAPLVVFAGHGSQTSNNPFQSSLDCGACAGNNGRHNARLLADICNEPEIRKLLAEENDIQIPEETWFIGAEHNTTTNHIHLFDSNVPDYYQKRLSKLKTDLTAAQHTANREQFNLTREGISKTMREARRRAADWAETRPEWGLAGNASFIIGRRELTSHLDLEARSFLHSYDWEKDPDGDKLEAILQGPMVVTQWINNHYYFATVDNEHLGGGTKVTLNVTGKYGVVQGNGGDLKFGLPLESLQEDDYILQHLPLRLTVLVQAPRSRVESIISKHRDTMYNLVKNEWIYLAVLDPEMDNEVTFIGDNAERLEKLLMENAY